MKQKIYTEKEYKKLEKQFQNYKWAFEQGLAADKYLLNQYAALATFVDEIFLALQELMEKIDKKR